MELVAEITHWVPAMKLLSLALAAIFVAFGIAKFALLDHRAHGAVKHQDSFFEAVLQEVVRRIHGDWDEYPGWKDRWPGMDQAGY